MKRLKSIFAISIAALMCGCASVAVSPDRRVTISEDLGDRISVTDVRLVRVVDGYPTFQVNVVNNTSGDLGVEWKVVWTDADGVAYDTLVSSWNKLMIGPNAAAALKNTCPRRDAADLSCHIRRLR